MLSLTKVRRFESRNVALAVLAKRATTFLVRKGFEVKLTRHGNRTLLEATPSRDAWNRFGYRYKLKEDLKIEIKGVPQDFDLILSPGKWKDSPRNQVLLGAARLVVGGSPILRLQEQKENYEKMVEELWSFLQEQVELLGS
jgi:hypothetical protein